ncbi:type I glyceraldehyde-3-phosphate dehydrogenase [Klebsiella pneumoniae]
MKKILIIVPDGGMLFESAGIADILMQANRLHPEGAREICYQVKLATTQPHQVIHGQSGLNLLADHRLHEIDPREPLDTIMITGRGQNPQEGMAVVDWLRLAAPLAHLLKYDSLLGKLDAEVTAGEGGLVVDGKPITVFSERNPASIPWRQCEVDIVIEATGLFTDREKAAVHIHSGGAKRVIISAPGKNDDLTIVMGVNESLYSPDKHYVISNGSCTTNGLAPAAQVLHQHFGIKHGLMNTTHAYTNSQALHDQPEKDLRGARAAALSIVPYSSGAAKALGKVIPELDGRLTGYSLRVPVPVVSIVDLTVTLERDVTVEEVNNAFREAAAAGPLKGILGYSDEPLVSSDYQGDPRSSIIDGLSTLVIGGNMVKILAWYDNEWGFSNRLVDLALMMAKRES